MVFSPQEGGENFVVMGDLLIWVKDGGGGATEEQLNGGTLTFSEEIGNCVEKLNE